MKISYKGDYSLKVILDLSKNFPNNLVSILDLSKRQDIPKKFLEQILLDLKKGGFLMSKKGPKGGYSLARSPETITLGEVVRYVEGSVYPISCVDPSNPSECLEKISCVFAPIWVDVGDAITSIIDDITFKDLMVKQEQLTKSTVLDFQI
jgi:Rrf2 family protein